MSIVTTSGRHSLYAAIASIPVAEVLTTRYPIRSIIMHICRVMIGESSTTNTFSAPISIVSSLCVIEICIEDFPWSEKADSQTSQGRIQTLREKHDAILARNLFPPAKDDGWRHRNTSSIKVLKINRAVPQNGIDHFPYGRFTMPLNLVGVVVETDGHPLIHGIGQTFLEADDNPQIDTSTQGYHRRQVEQCQRFQFAATRTII